MSLAHQIEHFKADTSVAVPVKQVPLIVPARNKTNYRGQVRPVSVMLEEVMFTGRVPVSTWAFAFGLHQKLWVSDLTTLYFGKRVELNKMIYSDKLYVPDRRLDLSVAMTAYNSYGDIMQADKRLQGYVQAIKPGHSDLISLEQDWMQLVFKFRVQIG